MFRTPDLALSDNFRNFAASCIQHQQATNGEQDWQGTKVRQVAGAAGGFSKLLAYGREKIFFQF